MAANATVYATDPMQVASGTNSIPATPNLDTISARLGIASAAGNLASLPFQIANQYGQYKTQAQNAAYTADALIRESRNAMRIYNRESRQLAANQTLSFIMSGLDATPTASGQESTVENIQRITRQEREIDKQNIIQNYMTQVGNARRQEAAARKGGFNSIVGGLAQIGTTVGALAIFSDERLKERLIPVGKSKTGLTIYLGRYTKESGLDDGKVHLFLIAQEVQRVRPNAVKIADNGYFQVDYAAALL